MSLSSPDLMSEFAKVAAVTVIAVACAGTVAMYATDADGMGDSEVVWETDKCEAVQQAIRLRVPTPEIAQKVESHDMSPLDAQCLMGADVPDEIWIAALRSVARTHPRYREILDLPPGT